MKQAWVQNIWPGGGAVAPPLQGKVFATSRVPTDVTGLVELYTDNGDFLNGKKLENDPS